MVKQTEEIKEVEVKAPKIAFKYSCPACTNTAIETSNEMLGVEVDCMSCGTRIKLDNKEAYQAI